MIDDALKGEIEVSIRVKLVDLSEEDKQHAIKAYFDKNTQNIPDSIKKMALLSVTIWDDRKDPPVRCMTLSQVILIS